MTKEEKVNISIFAKNDLRLTGTRGGDNQKLSSKLK